MYWQIFSLKKLMIFIQYLIKCNLDYKIESQNTLYKDSGILEWAILFWKWLTF